VQDREAEAATPLPVEDEATLKGQVARLPYILTCSSGDPEKTCTDRDYPINNLPLGILAQQPLSSPIRSTALLDRLFPGVWSTYRTVSPPSLSLTYRQV
jgi:hypothetical protein